MVWIVQCHVVFCPKRLSFVGETHGEAAVGALGTRPVRPCVGTFAWGELLRGRQLTRSAHVNGRCDSMGVGRVAACRTHGTSRPRAPGQTGRPP